MVALYTRDKARQDRLVASAPLPGCSGRHPLTLLIEIDGGTMGFRYAAGGKPMTLATDVDATFLSTRKAGGFVGTIIGPYVGQGDAAQSTW